MAHRAVSPCSVLLVTRNAVTHAEVTYLLDPRLAHGTNVAVARRALESETEMYRVDEVGVVRKLVHLVPEDGLVLLECRDELFEFRAPLGGDDLVALHAEFEGGKGRLGGGRCVAVAIGTVQSNCLNVDLVWELDRLCLDRLSRWGQEIRACQYQSERNRHDNQHDQHEQDQSDVPHPLGSVPQPNPPTTQAIRHTVA